MVFKIFVFNEIGTSYPNPNSTFRLREMIEVTN